MDGLFGFGSIVRVEGCRINDGAGTGRDNILLILEKRAWHLGLRQMSTVLDISSVDIKNDHR
jgi:hypothetical protein